MTALSKKTFKVSWLLVLAGMAVGVMAPANPAHATLVSYVKSIEYVAITIALGSTSGSSSNLTKGQNTANCVPFVTSQFASLTDFNTILADVYFEAGPKVTATRSTSGAVVNLGVFVVEFDSTKVRVQSGNIVSFSTATSSTTISTGVNQAKAALVFYYKSSNASSDWVYNMVAGSFSANDTLYWQRDAASGSISGHYYVFEALNSEFAVQAKTIAIASGGTSGTATLSPSVTMAKTFLTASHRTNRQKDEPMNCAPQVYLSATDTITASRYGNDAYTININVFAITFAGDETVERGSFSFALNDTLKDFTLATAVSTDEAIAWNIVTRQGSIAVDSDSELDHPATFQRLQLTSSGTKVQGDRGYGGSANYQGGTGRWEVIAFTQQPILEQEGFCFRNDNGSESGATGATQDTNISRAKNMNTRLRFLVNATYDPQSQSFQIEYKKSTDGTYNKVLTAQPGTVLPTYVNAGTIASGTSTISPALPAGIQANDILLLFVESANQAISISNQNNGIWTQASDSPQGVGASPPTDPATRLAVFWSRYNGSQGAPTVADPGDHAVGRMIAIRGCIASGDPFDVTAGGTEAVSDTLGSIPGDATTVANTFVVVAITSSYDQPTSNSIAEFDSWSNADLANLTERTDDSRTSGNGGGIGVATGEKASAGSYGATSVTLAHNAYKAMWTGALKPVPATQQAILISASTNIAASGENTTAQLTPPSGKTTSNFTAGRIQDDENPADVVDIAADYYTELEWCLTATDAAQVGDIYQFRVTKNGTVLNSYSVTPQWTIIDAPTAISLLSFTATGAGSVVEVDWQTAQEVRNKGFDLYRAESPGGVWVKLNAALIPAASESGEGRSYRFTDQPPVVGRLYYYRLEDVDVSGAVTVHGPVCVDWDADGMPDDWEIAHGLNPLVNDANLDSDGDGVPNGLEYLRGTNPLVWDSDGDGISDGAETKSPGYSGAGAAAGFGDAGVQVLAQDAGGLTLELWTRSFDVTSVEAAGQVFERLRVPGYVHGYTQETGLPQLPVKGMLLDIPSGKRAAVQVLGEDTRLLPGYRVYPAPKYRVGEDGQLAEVFAWNEASYEQNAYYPAAAAELSTEYVFRGEVKQRLVFYPLRFNPATGELLHSERIRVRVAYGEPAFAQGFGGQARAASAAVAAAEGGWAIPAGAAYKLSTAGEGIYRVTQTGLLAAGISASDIDAIDLTHVQLFNFGEEQVLYVVDANANHRLDPGDSITFYAGAVPAAYAKYAKYNIYWLIDAGSAASLRMGTIDGSPSGGPLADSHTATVHHELDQTYLQSAVGADGVDRWIFSSIAMGSGFASGGVAKDFTFSVPGALATGDLKLRLYSPYEMAHETQVLLNGVVLGTAVWSGIGWTEASFAGVALQAGSNTVSILCQGALDKTAVDWMAVLYDRDFAPVSDSLKFSHAAGYRYQVSGFSTNDVELYDITDTAGVSRVVNGTSTGVGPYTLEVEPAAASGTASYLAVASSALKTPSAVVADSASSLASSANGADWILITHREIGWEADGSERSWMADLVALRQGQGLRTTVVDVEDIFDEFGYGLPTPEAIKAFLSYAYENWQRPAPQYVLLVGDTSYDYKDNWGLGTVNHVPGYLIYTENLGETVCEECYGQVSGDDALADLYIGRLPASSAAQAEAMVSKIIAYETAVNRKLWERRLVLVADNQAEDWEAVFETMNEDAAALLPAGMDSPERFYLQEYENEALAVTDLTAELLSAIEAGALIVNYSGHGSLNIWATEQILDNRGGANRLDMSDLSNPGMYPFVVNMSCLTGYFIYPKAGAYAASSWRSLAEGWMQPETAGAVAALMPTGMTDSGSQHILSDALYEGIFTLDKRRLGPAVAYAKEQLLANGGAAYEETSHTFMLFGDPATELKVPLPHRPAGFAAELEGTSVRLTWASTLDCDGNPVAGYNLYRRLSTEPSYTKLNTALITGLSYTDTAAVAGATCYYALTAVDTSNDESVRSASVAATLGAAQSSSGGGAGCFVSTAAADVALDLLMPFAIMALLGCLAWIERKTCRTKQRRKNKGRFA